MKQEPEYGASFHKVNPVLQKPVESLEEKNESELCHECRTEVISEDCERETSLGQCVPASLDQMLSFSSPEAPEK